MSDASRRLGAVCAGPLRCVERTHRRSRCCLWSDRGGEDVGLTPEEERLYVHISGYYFQNYMCIYREYDPC